MKDLVQDLPDVTLEAPEESALAARIQKGDEDALVELVMATMRRAVLYVQRVDRGQLDVPTLISLCYQELSMAAKRFKPKYGCRFFAFAKAGLRGRAYRHWNSTRVVRHQTEQVSLDGLETPSVREVVEAKGARAVRDIQISAFENGQPGDTTNEWRSTTRELMTGEIEDDGLTRLMAKDRWEAIRKRLNNLLPEQYWMVIELTYKGRLNFQQIGNLLGFSRARAARCHALGMEKLRNALKHAGSDGL